MKKKLIKLLLPILAILAGVFFLYSSGQDYRTSDVSLFIPGILLFFGGSAIFIFFWVDVGDELRQSPSVLVYIITFVFFGIPQLILGILYIVFCLVTAFPLGLFSLHKTLPKGGEHLAGLAGKSRRIGKNHLKHWHKNWFNKDMPNQLRKSKHYLQKEKKP